MAQIFFRNAFSIGIVNFVLLLKAIVLVPVLSKKFGPIGYGAWSQVAVLVGIITPLLGLGIDSGFNRFVPAESRPNQIRALWSMVWFQSFMAALCGLGLWVFSKTVSHLILGTGDAYRLVIICGLVIYATMLMNDVKYFFRAVVSVRYLNLILLVQGFGSLGVVLVIYISGGNVEKIVLGGGLFDLLLAVGCLATLAGKYGMASVHFAIIKKYVSFGWVLLPTAYSIWILNLSDRLFLIHFNPLAVVGVYSVAYALGNIPIQLIFAPIWTFFGSVAAKEWEAGNREEIQRIFNGSLKIAGSLIILAMSLICVFYRPIMAIFASREFLINPWLVVAICLGYSFHMIGAYGGIVLSLGRKPKLDTYTNLGAAGVNITLNFLLIPKYGIYGAAVSTCLSFLFQCVFELKLSAKFVRLRVPGAFLAKCAVGGAAVIGMERAASFSTPGIPFMALHILLFCCFYAIVLLLMKAFSVRQIWAFLRQMSGRDL